MKIELIGTCVPSNIIKAKFIVLSTENGEVFVRVYSHTDKYHSELVSETNEKCHEMRLRNLVGAGYFYPRDMRAEWDSSSCKHVYGREEPKDYEFGEKLLREIEEFCKAHTK